MLELFRNELLHFLVSLGLAIVFTPQLGFVSAFIIVFTSGFFLDIDHLFDYGLYLKKRNKKFRVSEFLSGQHFTQSHRMFVFLHSWELVILLWLPYLYFKEIGFWAASLALLSHLIVDQFTNNIPRYFYSLTFRYLNNFKHF